MTDRFLPDGAWFWKGRMAKGGVYVGAMTWLGPPYVDGEVVDRSPRYQILLRNETTGRMILMGDMTPIVYEPDGYLRNLERIERAEYLFLVTHSAWSTQHAPHLPDASPTTQIDFNKMKPVF